MVLLKEGDSVTITFRDMNGLTTFLRRKEIARGDCFILDSLPMSDGYCCALIGSVSRNQLTPAVTIRDILLRDCNESSVALYPRGEGLSVNFWKKKEQMHSKSLLVTLDDLGTSRVDSVAIWTDRLAFDCFQQCMSDRSCVASSVEDAPDCFLLEEHSPAMRYYLSSICYGSRRTN